jgi:hypothetical protein
MSEKDTRDFCLVCGKWTDEHERTEVQDCKDWWARMAGLREP